MKYFLFSEPAGRYLKTRYNCQTTISRVESIASMAAASSTNLTSQFVNSLKMDVNILLATTVSPSCTRDQLETFSTVSDSITVRTRIKD